MENKKIQDCPFSSKVESNDSRNRDQIDISISIHDLSLGLL